MFLTSRPVRHICQVHLIMAGLRYDIAQGIYQGCVLSISFHSNVTNSTMLLAKLIVSPFVTHYNF